MPYGLSCKDGKKISDCRSLIWYKGTEPIYISMFLDEINMGKILEIAHEVFPGIAVHELNVSLDGDDLALTSLDIRPITGYSGPRIEANESELLKPFKIY